MIRAIIFDFNGVLADDETLHVACFRQALAESGLSLTAEEYYGRYLGMDERTCTTALLAARDGRCDTALLDRILRRKAELFREETVRHKPPLFPGVVEFVNAAAARYRLAVASGGRREQIDRALEGTAIEHRFDVIVSADECPVGKPDPAMYLLTLARLNERHPALPPLTARDCLVIEDSKAGLRSARAAGMTVVGLATTYPAGQLIEADLVLPDLAGMHPDRLCRQLTRITDQNGPLPGPP